MSQDLTHANASNVISELVAQGLTNDEARLFSPQVARQAMMLIRLRHYTESYDQRMARALLTDRCYGVPEVTDLMECTFTEIELARLDNIPNESVLREFRKNCVLVAGYPLTLGGMYSQYQRSFPQGLTPDWKGCTVQCKWMAIQTKIPESLFRKNYGDQVQLANLDHGLHPIGIADLVFMTLLYYKRNNEYPFSSGTSLRTNTVIDSKRLMLTFTGNGLQIEPSTDGDCGQKIGIALGMWI